MTDIEFTKEEEAARSIADRSFVYGTLAECLDFPDEVLLDAISDGRLLAGVCDIFAGELNAGDFVGLAESSSVEALKADYMTLFEVSNPQGALCSLFGGQYYGDRMQIMEEHVRFYNYFELHMPDKIEELPDHLCAELEFLRYLSTQEALAVQQGESPESFRKAQRDFMSRHPLRWIERLKDSVTEHATSSFYPALISLISAVLSLENARLTRALDSSSIPAVSIH